MKLNAAAFLPVTLSLFLSFASAGAAEVMDQELNKRMQTTDMLALVVGYEAKEKEESARQVRDEKGGVSAISTVSSIISSVFNSTTSVATSYYPDITLEYLNALRAGKKSREIAVLLKQSIRGPVNSLPGLPVVASVASSGFGYVAYNVGSEMPDSNAETLLNQDRMNQVATEASENLGNLFGLNADKKNTLKAAIKQEIMTQARESSDKIVELNFFKILAEANFKGEPVLSKPQLAAIDLINRTDHTDDENSFTGMDAEAKANAIEFKTAQLKAALEMYKERLGPKTVKWAMDEIKKNEKAGAKFKNAQALSKVRPAVKDEGVRVKSNTGSAE